MAIILLIYVSPLTIVCAMFERTKGIFENWWKQMLGFILQPMILFAYVGLMLTVFDNLFIGTARFNSVLNDSSILPKVNCDSYTDNGKNYIPSDTSVYCIFNFGKYSNYTGLELFDLAMPILTSLNPTKIRTIFQSAIIMFVFLQFFDKITTVAANLVGGAELKSDSGSAMLDQVKKITKGVQDRALNTVNRAATKQIPNAKKNKIGKNSEKDTPPPPKDKPPGDSVA
jgi:type IV secretion system protein VirB6